MWYGFVRLNYNFLRKSSMPRNFIKQQRLLYHGLPRTPEENGKFLEHTHIYWSGREETISLVRTCPNQKQWRITFRPLARLLSLSPSASKRGSFCSSPLQMLPASVVFCADPLSHSSSSLKATLRPVSSV
jgi:hypothetical protein